MFVNNVLGESVSLCNKCLSDKSSGDWHHGTHWQHPNIQSVLYDQRLMQAIYILGSKNAQKLSFPRKILSPKK